MPVMAKVQQGASVRLSVKPAFEAIFASSGMSWLYPFPTSTATVGGCNSPKKTLRCVAAQLRSKQVVVLPVGYAAS